MSSHPCSGKTAIFLVIQKFLKNISKDHKFISHQEW
jgi:hypothetical protein